MLIKYIDCIYFGYVSLSLHLEFILKMKSQ